MSVPVVDRLEAVEVEVGHREQRVAPLRLRHRLMHAVGEQRAVGQRRQHVVVRDVFEPLFVFLECRDVREQATYCVGLPCAS